MTYADDLAWLFARERFGWKFGLERIEHILDMLGNPEKDLDIIHIAGTNGKGSTAAMLSQILDDAGRNVGLFTSPHIVDFRERIQRNGRYIPERDVQRLIHTIRRHNIPLTFFEFVTAMALLHFHQQNVDHVVLETGLGGRLDATNAAPSHIQAITSIDLEHTKILGDTVEAIAGEKAGIIKPGSHVFVPYDCHGLATIRQHCTSSTLILTEHTDLPLSLPGAFQRSNAGIAIAIAEHLGIEDRHIRTGLLHAHWPGRLERFGSILLDCAHNPASIEALARHLQTLTYSELIVIFGVLEDKDADAMRDLLPRHTGIYAAPNSPRARDMIAGMPKMSAEDALTYAQKICPDDGLILVTGSCYLVSEVRSFLSHQTPK